MFFSYISTINFICAGNSTVGRALGSGPRGHEFESRFSDHIETIGLIPKVSVLFSFYRAILLILGINCLIFGCFLNVS